MQVMLGSCRQDWSLAFQGAEIYQEKKNSKFVEVLLYVFCDELRMALTIFCKNLAVHISVQSPGPCFSFSRVSTKFLRRRKRNLQ